MNSTKIEPVSGAPRTRLYWLSLCLALAICAVPDWFLFHALPHIAIGYEDHSELWIYPLCFVAWYFSSKWAVWRCRRAGRSFEQCNVRAYPIRGFPELGNPARGNLVIRRKGSVLPFLFCLLLAGIVLMIALVSFARPSIATADFLAYLLNIGGACLGIVLWLTPKLAADSRGIRYGGMYKLWPGVVAWDSIGAITFFEELDVIGWVRRRGYRVTDRAGELILRISLDNRFSSPERDFEALNAYLELISNTKRRPNPYVASNEQGDKWRRETIHRSAPARDGTATTSKSGFGMEAMYLFCGLLMITMMCMFPLYDHNRWELRQNPAQCALVVGCAIVTLLSACFFWRPRFEINEAGVVSKPIFSRRITIPWSDIDSFEVTIKSRQPPRELKAPARHERPVVSVRMADVQENTLLEVRTEYYDAGDSKFVRALIEGLSLALTGSPASEAMIAELA